MKRLYIQLFLTSLMIGSIANLFAMNPDQEMQPAVTPQATVAQAGQQQQQPAQGMEVEPRAGQLRMASQALTEQEQAEGAPQAKRQKTEQSFDNPEKREKQEAAASSSQSTVERKKTKEQEEEEERQRFYAARMASLQQQQSGGGSSSQQAAAASSSAQQAPAMPAVGSIESRELFDKVFPNLAKLPSDVLPKIFEEFLKDARAHAFVEPLNMTQNLERYSLQDLARLPEQILRGMRIIDAEVGMVLFQQINYHDVYATFLGQSMPRVIPIDVKVNSPVTAIALSSTAGRWLVAVARSNGSIKVWQLLPSQRQPKLLREVSIELPQGQKIADITFNPKSTHVGAVTDDNRAFVFNISDENEPQVIAFGGQYQPEGEPEMYFYSIRFNSDGTNVVVLNTAGDVEVLNLVANEPVMYIHPQNASARYAAFFSERGITEKILVSFPDGVADIFPFIQDNDPDDTYSESTFNNVFSIRPFIISRENLFAVIESSLDRRGDISLAGGNHLVSVTDLARNQLAYVITDQLVSKAWGDSFNGRNYVYMISDQVLYRLDITKLINPSFTFDQTALLYLLNEQKRKGVNRIDFELFGKEKGINPAILRQALESFSPVLQRHLVDAYGIVGVQVQESATAGSSSSAAASSSSSSAAASSQQASGYEGAQKQ